MVHRSFRLIPINTHKEVTTFMNELSKIREIVKRNPHNKIQNITHYINKATLTASHQSMDASKATGIDKVGKDKYHHSLNDNIDNLLSRMRRQSYKPVPVRRAYIDKIGSTKKRPLGIPAYEDKLVQRVMTEILNTIYEPIFLPTSYGFRKDLNCHKAIKSLRNTIQMNKISYVVDADIKSFFDNVNHDWIIEFVKYRIDDKRFINLINKFLKSGVMEQGKFHTTPLGTPQGGIISPVLANIYLHFVLDLWFEKVVKKYSKGEAHIVRYADDFVCCFQYKEDAERFYSNLIPRLKKFNLEIAEDKTKIIEFGRFAEISRRIKGMKRPETFNFLGFTFYCSKSINGKFRVKMKTNLKKLTVKINIIKTWIKENMHMDVKDFIKRINLRLGGHYRYYGITDNYKSITTFYHEVLKYFYKTLNRRSQKRSFTWETYKRNIVPQIMPPKLYVSVID
jgi:RNA-directed DNA polymerase